MFFCLNILKTKCNSVRDRAYLRHILRTGVSNSAEHMRRPGKFVQPLKLDGVWPVDNRPSTNYPYHFVKEKWHVTPDM